MGSQSEVLRLVGEVTERYGSLEAFFTRLRAEFDDQPTMQLPVVDPAAGEPVAWSAVSADAETSSPTVEVETSAAESDEEYDELQERTARGPVEFVGTSLRGAAGMWGRLTGRMR